jgi:hypothetical protein
MSLSETENWNGPRLTERDIDALRWLVEQRAASLDQVGRLLNQIDGGNPITDRRVRQVVARWEQLGLAAKWQVWHGQPAVVIATGRAAAMFGQTRWRRPGIAIVRHTVAVSEIRLRVAPISGTRNWVSESTLRRQLPKGEHLPDGGWYEDGLGVAVEVELTPHGRKRVESTMKELLYAHDGAGTRWARVLYLCSPATIGQVTAAWEALPPAERARITVRPMP